MTATEHTNGNGISPRPWDERLGAVAARFPSTADDWHGALGDIELMGRLFRDCLRVGHTTKRRGARPLLDIEDGEARLRQLLGEDYSTLGFAEAFQSLLDARSMSRTSVARLAGISRSRCARLLAGEVEPTMDELERVARAFAKPPTYFLEYRVELVVERVRAYLTEAPETSVGLVRELGLEA